VHARGDTRAAQERVSQGIEDSSLQGEAAAFVIGVPHDIGGGLVRQERPPDSF
jgi:hypothetical protein